jgi:hypothetical protein
MKLLNATDLDRKSGIRGPKTKFFECFSFPSTDFFSESASA